MRDDVSMLREVASWRRFSERLGRELNDVRQALAEAKASHQAEIGRAEARGYAKAVANLLEPGIHDMAVGHQRYDGGGGCHCGWNELGLSYVTHLLKQIAATLEAVQSDA